MDRDAASSFWDGVLLPDGTPEGQRAAVTSSGGLITVGAGAGTGKTWVLSNRYARLLLTDPDCLPCDVLTLTYTDAAAGEMRRRIEDRVRALMDVPGAPVVPERRREVLEGFSEAWISTIHAFAARLVRESGLALDVDPRSAVVSGPQTERFWARVRDALEEAGLGELADACGSSHLRAVARELDQDPLISAAVGRWGAEALKDLAREAAELHADLGHRWEDMMRWGEEALREDDPQARAAGREVLALLRLSWRRAWATWRDVFDALAEDIRAAGAAAQASGRNVPDRLLMEFMERWEGRLSGPEATDEELRAFYLEVMDRDCVKGGNSGLLKKVKEVLGTTLGAWQDAEVDEGTPLLSALSPDAPLPEPERLMRSALLRFCAAAWGLWDAERRRRGLLSFSDMILQARAAVESGKAQRTFRHILVDEFQDTDPLQFGMIETLRREGVRSLFAVGDPKQSIYGFRHAEPSLFAEAIGRADARVTLDVSFRTRGALLTRLNDLFAHVWRDGLGTSEAMSRLEFEPLSPARSGERGAGTTAPFSVLLAVKEGRAVVKARRQLAGALARRVARWVDEGCTVWDKGLNVLRPLRYGDFAVLARTRGSHELLEDAFAAAGVPAVQDRSRDYFSRGEVTDVICLLRAAEDWEDGAAVFGWLMSPFSGVPIEEARRCLERIGGTIRTGRGVMEALREALPDAAARLERISLIGRRNGPTAILSPLDRDRRWLSNLPEKERLRALRNVRRAVSIARSFQRGSASSLAACADWMDRALRRGVDMEEPAWHGEGVNAVLLSTVHASKGLEYPVVAIFDTAKRRRPRTLCPSRTLGVAFAGLPDELSASRTPAPDPLSMDWERALTRQGEREEDLRLLYVAATRAQDSLIHCGLVTCSKDECAPAEKGGWTSIVLDWMQERGDCGPDMTGPDVELIPPGDGAQPAGKPRRSVPTPAPVAVARPDSGARELAVLSATSFSLMEWCPLAWRRRYRQGLDLAWEAPRGAAEEDGRGGSDLGSLAHWILARWPSAEGDAEAELERWLTDPRALRSLPTLLRDVWREEENRNALRPWLLHFAGSEAGVMVRGALPLGARREAGFRVEVGGLALSGAMDVVWREGEVWRVLDYKVTLMQNAPEELYSAQLDLYALAARKGAELAGEPCSRVEAGLVFLREGSPLRMRRVEDWEAIEGRVRAAARLGAVRDLPPREEHCPRCPWRSSCPAAR